MDLLINEISATGTITETATGTKEFAMKIQMPFLDFLWVAITFFAAFVVFNLFFRKIWK